MELKYRYADTNDIDLLIGIYDSAFYDDHLRYGHGCQAYGRSKKKVNRRFDLHGTES